MPIIDPTMADELLVQKQISPELHAQLTAAPTDPLATAQPLPPPEEEMIAGQNKTAAQRYLDQQARGDVPEAPPMEVAPEDRVSLKPDWIQTVDDANQPPRDVMEQAVARERDGLAENIEKKRNAFRLQGLPESMIDKLLADDMTQLASYNMGPSAQTAQVDPADEGEVSLASDRMSDPTARVGDPNAYAMPWMDTSAFDKKRAGVLLEQQAAYEGGQQEAAAIAGYRDKAEQLEGDRQMMRLKQEAELEKFQTDLKGEIDRVGSMKVDTGRKWKNMSTGSKIASIVGVMLSGYAQGLSGRGGNPALEMLQNAISEDIAAQKTDIANAREGVQQKRGVYNDMRAKFKDDEIAHSAAMAAGLNDAKLQLQEIAARTQSQQAKANVMKQIADIDMAQKEYENKAKEKYLAQLAAQSGDPRFMTEDQRARYVPGYGIALTKEDAKRVKEKSATIDTARDGLNDLLALTRETGKSLSFEQRAKAKTTANMLIGNLRTEIVGPGAMNEREVELMNDIIANPTKLLSLDSTNRAALETVLKRLDSSMENELRSAGLVSPKAAVGFTRKEN